MYATCLFCHSALGANEVIERFPVGRRLAFDSDKGRLWVVCRKCERWNLTPIEERWEAIEDCERLFRETKLRVSTDNIGLARVREGLELVRIGRPQRPELAAWRYGDQFGRRRNRHVALSVAGGVAIGGIAILGPLAGVATGGGFGLFQLGNGLYSLYRNRVVRARVVVPEYAHPVVVRRAHLDQTTIERTPDGWQLRVHYERPRDVPKRDSHGHLSWPNVGPSKIDESTLTGADALRAAGQLLPAINAAGANKESVTRAVNLLEGTPDPDTLFARMSSSRMTWSAMAAPIGGMGVSGRRLKKLPPATRLALEMASHEDTERRALEGELALLEDAWKQAEEIASIADSMFVPSDTNERLGEMKRDGQAAEG